MVGNITLRDQENSLWFSVLKQQLPPHISGWELGWVWHCPRFTTGTQSSWLSWISHQSRTPCFPLRRLQVPGLGKWQAGGRGVNYKSLLWTHFVSCVHGHSTSHPSHNANMIEKIKFCGALSMTLPQSNGNHQFSTATIANYHQQSGWEQHEFITLQLPFWHGSNWIQSKLWSWLQFFVESPWENPA